MSIDTIKSIGVIGAGQMGTGIAQVAAQSGYKVLVFDVASESLERSKKLIEKLLNRGVEKGKWDQAQMEQAVSLLTWTNKMEDIKDSDIVIEAATENKPIKFKIFQQLDELCPPNTILASNTSSISITELAAQTKRAGLIAGMHFMNPVPVMKLVEGIRGLETTDETFHTVGELAKKMGKTFIEVNDFPGFAINRVLMPMINEAIYALYEGVATKESLDTGMKLGTNQPMGPIELADFIGLDTCLSIMEVLHEGLADSKYRPCPLLRKYVLSGRLGKKVGRGFYDY